MNPGEQHSIRAAVERLEDEYRFTLDERDAFECFADAAAELDTVTPSDTARPTAGAMRTDGFGGSYPTDTSQLRDAYRETVMDTPQYDAAYDEPLAVNLRAELGRDIAVALLADNPVTPHLQQAVVAVAKREQTKRAEFLKTLDSERDTLRSAMETLSTGRKLVETVDGRQWRQCSFDEIRKPYRRVVTHHSECRELLADRQTQRQTGHTRIRDESVSDLQSYLYHELDVTYPVLSDTVQLSVDLRSAKRRLSWWLARRA